MTDTGSTMDHSTVVDSPKKRRQDAIRDIIEHNPIDSQSALVLALEKRGFGVNQSTVSRDIREMHLIKVTTGMGKYVYAMPGNGAETNIPQRLIRIFSDSIVSSQNAENIVVVKTLSGSAGAVAEALDGLMWPEIAGTLAGDNTIMIVTRSRNEATQVNDQIQALMGRGRA